MSSKGVTPVIATILMVTVTVAAAGSLYSLTQNVQEENRENVEVSIPDKSDLFVESCYRDSSFTNLSVRNSNKEAINASVIIPFVEGRPADDYSVDKEVVDSGSSFQISINEVLDENTLIEITIKGDQITHLCT